MIKNIFKIQSIEKAFPQKNILQKSDPLLFFIVKTKSINQTWSDLYVAL